MARPRFGVGWQPGRRQGSRACLSRSAAARRRLVGPADHEQQRLFHREGLGRLANRGPSGLRSRIPARRAVPAEHSNGGRLVVRQDPCTGLAAVLRCWLPAWRRSVYLIRRDKLGDHGTDAGRARRRTQYNSRSGAAVTPGLEYGRVRAAPHPPYPFLIAARIRAGVIGNCGIRTPAASKIALASTDATLIIGGSPLPAARGDSEDGV